ncbi:MAG: UDP-N-acetylglucosamine 2-epimerase (non-hydrolyzing) [Bacteroidota bacterium]
MFKNILTIVGTRPNFIKVTQFARHLHRPEKGIHHKLLHTGQHYDDKMSRVFFEQFGLHPDFWLNVEPGSPNTQIGHIILGVERIVRDSFRPDLILVTGDVNSTLAAALAAHKLGIPLGHIESGLRSFDKTMPEEWNRILTDELSDFLFVTEQSGMAHLEREGKSKDSVFFVGNTMIDTLVAFESDIQASDILQRLNLQDRPYALMTMHRPATVDHQEELERLIEMVKWLCSEQELVFPIHPRTKNNLEKFGLYDELINTPGLSITGPLDYFSFQHLIAHSHFVLTDSGGIQEETTFRQVPCLTLRPNTERPSTCEIGTNTLLPFELPQIKDLISSIRNNTYKGGVVPPLWDGQATKRIADIIFQKRIPHHGVLNPGR